MQSGPSEKPSNHGDKPRPAEVPDDDPGPSAGAGGLDSLELSEQLFLSVEG